MSEPIRDSLDQRLGRLAREVAPPAHVWRAVSEGIHGPRRARFALPIAAGIAAGIAAAVLGGTLVWTVFQGRMGAPRGSVPLLADGRGGAREALAEPAEPADPQYTAARTAIQTSFRDRLSMLPPPTRRQVEADLESIRRAHADLGRALAQNPASPVLQRLYESTWHDEFGLYERVLRATQASITTT